MLESIVNCIKAFRQQLYDFFPHRQDAAMELVDALTSNTQAKSVVELSLNSLYRRNYCSITRALSEYYAGLTTLEKQQQNQRLTLLLARQCVPLENRAYHLFSLDGTSQERRFARTLADRSMVHRPNTIAGNKPITLGHRYSVVGYVPESPSTSHSSWIVPLSCERVTTEQKETSLGMEQLDYCTKQSVFKDKLCVSVGDCAYSNLNCLSQVNHHPNQVHISRARNNRLFYDPPREKRQRRPGRPRQYGKKFQLNAKRLRRPDETTTFNITTQRGKELTIIVEGWNAMRVRGKRQIDTSKLLFRLCRIRAYDVDGSLVFKRPMWLIIAGEKRHQLSLREIYDSYYQRFSIEHFFKFSKHRLLLNKVQTPAVNHEEAFWQFAIMAYHQLYLSRPLAHAMPTPWQRYLEVFKSSCEKSPSQVQKSFPFIIQQLGTPAKPPKPRNKSFGRKKGEIQVKRQRYKIIFKRKNSFISHQMQL